MAITKTKIAAITYAATNAAAGSTKGTPGVSSGWKDLTGAYAADLSWRIVNGASAPGIAPTLTIQVSPDSGATFYDYYTVGGDTAANSDNSGTIAIDPGIQYARVIGFGNTTNAVGIGADFSALTAL